MRCEKPPLCWLKLLLLLLLLLLKLNLAPLASKPPFPVGTVIVIVAESYAFFAARAALSSETFWPRLPITLQGTQFKATVE